MRDEFTNKTKDTLAKRVAWRCSFSGCARITVGPGHQNSNDIVNLGEAAHINAASPKGPRFDETMSPEQRKSIDNGVWMCRHHARMIDSDFFNYSAATLKQWKEIAENETYRLLKELEGTSNKKPTTLVAIGKEIVFEGFWKAVKKGFWVFEVHRFLIGKEEDLTYFNETKRSPQEKYIVIESQGDGRILDGSLEWELVNDILEISFKVEDKLPRSTPYDLTDISANFEFEDGDFKLVKGEDCAKQAIMIALSTDFGDMWYSPSFGSFFSMYYWAFKDNTEVLKRFIKLEITRLTSIPDQKPTTKSGQPALNLMDNIDRPPLDFINRVIEVELLSKEIENDKITVRLRLEWGDGNHWEDKIDIYIKPEKEIKVHNTVYSALKRAIH
jgi:hypothetical protein